MLVYSQLGVADALRAATTLAKLWELVAKRPNKRLVWLLPQIEGGISLGCPYEKSPTILE